jgi:predicted solute-binding protein
LLKVNKDIEDVNYWALKKKVDDLKIIFVALQQNKENLQ